MSNRRYPRGSEWRRWDLQVHTPFSALNNGFGSDFGHYAKCLFERAVEKRIAVIGITDYFSIEGYKQLKEIVNQPGGLEELLGTDVASEARQILLLPNVELRTSVLVDGNRVNFHVIFSDAIDPQMIDEDFLREIKFTARSEPGSPDEKWSLTFENLKRLGQRLKGEHAAFQQYTDLFVGMNNAVVAHEEVTSVLERQASRFKRQFLIVVPADEDLSHISWNGQGHQARKLLIQKAHMLFSSNAGTREFGLGRRHATREDFIKEFGRPKPCIHGSDAHSYESLFEPAKGRYLWVKADPTFYGLQQLLHEPAARLYVGGSPPFLARVSENATKYVDRIEFQRTPQAKPDEVWFSGQVPLNPGLAAIIGNKGSGKSALADILGLLGETRSSEHFSFLNSARFLFPKAMLGDMFCGKLHWRSGVETSRPLSASVDTTQPELVKYIPQNYLETICSELKESHETQFERELMEVIFSHVSDAECLGQETLSDLIEYLTNEKEQHISQLTKELSVLNTKIVAIEDELTEEHRKRLEAELGQRQAELKAHDEAKPSEVQPPSQRPEEQAAVQRVTGELEQYVNQARQLDAEIAKAQEQLKIAARQITAADRLLARIDNLERQVATFHDESRGDAVVLSLDTHKAVTLSVPRRPILDAKANANQRSDEAKVLLAPDAPNSLIVQRQDVSTQIETTRSRLDEPSRRYQEYLHDLANWEKRRSEIQGSPTIPTSVKGLEAKLAALSNLPAELARREAERLDLVTEIFQAKQQLLDDYRRLYAPVQKFIDEHPVPQQQGALQFSASMAVDGLPEGLLEMIHQGRRGSFQGEKEGRERLRELLERSDFGDEVGVRAFLAEAQDHLEHDKRDAKNAATRLREQLRQGRSPQDVYDLLYGLRYLRPRFELRWQGKPLDQLSPGERGNLLLVFYLLIDKRDIPLVIDQPEENLDNQTVATMLVPAIQYAKDRRQILIVTHNPNLAVVCDADQIIHSRLDKTDRNRVTYTAGAIENPEITQLIVDVLEGTKPAFDLRDAKYEILERR